MTAQSAQSIMDSIRRIVQALRISSRLAESELGLSGAQLFVLQKLAEAGREVTMTELATMTLTHISSVSVVVTRLADSGLLQKFPSPQDGRKILIMISDKGRTFLNSQPRTAQEELISAVGRLPEGEREQLALLLEKLITEAGFAGTETSMFFEPGRDSKL